MTEPHEPTPVASVGERYVLVELLESGNGREVWRGHDDLASRPVTVTRYLDATEEWRRSFDRRARALEQVSDPGIASALRHDADDDPPWLVTAWVDGETVADIEAGEGFAVDDALAVVGQTALALTAARDAGIGHGGLDAERIVVRPDGSVALTGFAVDASPSPDADLRALSHIAFTLVGDADVAPEVRKFLSSLETAQDPAEVGRTALALATAQRAAAGPITSLPPRGPDDRKAEPSRPWYSEEERKQVRNRLIALGAIVVIGGALLLRIISSGSGIATVPSVVGLPWVQAQHQLNEIGFRASETLTTGPPGSVGTVIAQDPRSGTRLKVGGVVHLTVVTAESR